VKYALDTNIFIDYFLTLPPMPPSLITRFSGNEGFRGIVAGWG
jgi:hypothetical protein